jgi:hypothetical protein
MLNENKIMKKQLIKEEISKLQTLAENKRLLTGKYEYPKYTNEQIEVLKEGFLDKMKAKFKDKFTYDPNVKAIYSYIKGGGKGDLKVQEYPYGTFPPELKRIGGNFTVSSSKIEEFAPKMEIDGDLNVMKTDIKNLGKDLTIKNDLFIINCTNLNLFPNKIFVGGSIAIKNTPIKSWPKNINKINGNLGLYQTEISELPSGLSVNGVLDLRDTPIKKIPDNLFVADSLYVTGCQNLKGLFSFGKNIRVDKNLHIKKTPLMNSLKSQDDVKSFIEATGMRVGRVHYGKKYPINFISTEEPKKQTADIGGKIRAKRTAQGGGGFGGQFGAGGKAGGGSRKKSIFNIFRESLKEAEYSPEELKEIEGAISILQKYDA